MGQFPQNHSSTDEIDLNKILSTVIRKKALIAKFTLAGLVVSSIFAISIKRVWQGEFQIVLENNSDKSTKAQLASSMLLGSLMLGGGSSSRLTTEVEILKSPSILIDIFEFIKKEKVSKSRSNLKSFRFKDWKKDYLEIKLEKGTSILSLAYKDKDKELIIPVLNKISSAYQEYSGRKRLRQLELGVNYFKNQVDIYKKKTIASTKAAQEFAIKEDLSVLDRTSEMGDNVPQIINIESIRVKSSNKVRLIDQKLNQLKNMENKKNQILFIASTNMFLKEYTEKFQTLESELSKLRLSYKENDKSIQNKLKEKNNLYNLIEKEVIASLIAQKEDALSALKAAQRPKGTLIKYRQLIEEAYKDKFTLDKLETEYRLVLLEKARSEDPWKLITTPTLLPFSVAPNRKKIAFIGMLGGLIAGFGAAMISEKKKDIVYSIADIESILGSPPLAKLAIINQKGWDDSLKLFSHSTLSKTIGSIAFIYIGEIDDLIIKNINKKLSKLLETRQFIITRKLIDALSFDNLIIITALGMSKSNDISELKKELLIQKKDLVGFISFY